MKFQHHFLESKYTIDDMVVLDNPILDFEQRNIKYANIGTEASTEGYSISTKGLVRNIALTQQTLLFIWYS